MTGARQTATMPKVQGDPGMRGLMIAALAALTTTGAWARNFPVGDVKAACQAEWPSDYSMQAYCFDQQREAFEKIAALRPGLDTIDAATLSDCADERSGDYSIQAYCLEQQIEARAALPVVGGDLPPEVADEIPGTCEAEWQGDFSMQAYGVEQQAAGWRQVNR